MTMNILPEPKLCPYCGAAERTSPCSTGCEASIVATRYIGASRPTVAGMMAAAIAWIGPSVRDAPPPAPMQSSQPWRDRGKFGRRAKGR